MWEYLVLDRTAYKDEPLPDALNRLGREGWEMCASAVHGPYSTLFYFKRPLTVLPDVVHNPEVLEAGILGGVVAEPAKDGWIEWGGGVCPVDEASMVEIRLRDGEITKLAAGGCDWHNCQWSSDIVAYRVVKP